MFLLGKRFFFCFVKTLRNVVYTRNVSQTVFSVETPVYRFPFVLFYVFKPTPLKYDGKSRLSRSVVCFYRTGLISSLDPTRTQPAVAQRSYGPPPTVLVASRPRNTNYFGFVYFRTEFVRRRNGCGSCPGSPPPSLRFTTI